MKLSVLTAVIIHRGRKSGALPDPWGPGVSRAPIPELARRVPRMALGRKAITVRCHHLVVPGLVALRASAATRALYPGPRGLSGSSYLGPLAQAQWSGQHRGSLCLCAPEELPVSPLPQGLAQQLVKTSGSQTWQLAPPVCLQDEIRPKGARQLKPNTFGPQQA